MNVGVSLVAEPRVIFSANYSMSLSLELLSEDLETSL